MTSLPGLLSGLLHLLNFATRFVSHDVHLQVPHLSMTIQASSHWDCLDSSCMCLRQSTILITAQSIYECLTDTHAAGHAEEELGRMHSLADQIQLLALLRTVASAANSMTMLGHLTSHPPGSQMSNWGYSSFTELILHLSGSTCGQFSAAKPGLQVPLSMKSCPEHGSGKMLRMLHVMLSLRTPATWCTM